jgi:hypothetical protein
MNESRAWVATIRSGLWSSVDLDAWIREPGVPDDAAIFSLAAGGGDVVYAGGRGVVHRRRGGRWTSAPLPDGALEPWSLASDPAAPDIVLAGCRPFALLRSDDGGEQWSALALELPEGTPRPHTPRVTAMLVGDGVMWCGAEIGGVFRSEDRGKTWAAMSDGLPSIDIHALAFAGPRRDAGAPLLAATNRGLTRWEVEERHGFAGALPSVRGVWGAVRRPPMRTGRATRHPRRHRALGRRRTRLGLGALPGHGGQHGMVDRGRRRGRAGDGDRGRGVRER